MNYNHIEQASSYVNSLLDGIQPSIAILTGTGMTGIDGIGKVILEIPYEDIPNFPSATVKSHAGILKLIQCNNQYVLLFSGRFHYYEGYDGADVCFPIYLMKMLGVSQLIMTNASGGLSETFKSGDVVLVNDHLNFMGTNPLRGKNEDRLGLRFPDLSQVYSQTMRTRFKSIIGSEYQEGIYAAMLGPSLETPAEYKFLKFAGADMVGMSTVPEVIAAAHADIDVAVLSVISNMCYPVVASSQTTIEDVISVVQKSNPKIVSYIQQFCNA